MSWLGDVGSFESFNLGKMLGQVKDNPARLLYGSADPFSTKVWNKILGTDDKPIIDQWGGAAPQRYEEAQKAGINTGPGATMHGIARTIASMYAGGALGNAMGGTSGASGASQGQGLLSSPSTVNLGNSTYMMDGSLNPAVSGATSQGGASMAGTQTTPGLLDQFNTAYTKYKPTVDAVKTGAEMFRGEQQQPVQPPPMMQYGNQGPQILAELANAGQTNAQNMYSSAEQARLQRRLGRRGLL